MSASLMMTIFASSSFFFFFICFFISSNAIDPLSSLRISDQIRSEGKTFERRNFRTELRKAIETRINEKRNQQSTCRSDEFLCSVESKCIYREWLCDGSTDCSDGSDELNCHEMNECVDGEFRCHGSGRCLPVRWVCDREKDCPDGSDELHCGSTQPPRLTDCPVGFTYVVTLSQCYSPTSEVFVDQREADALCKRLHPKAHLPAIGSTEQDFLIRHLILREIKPEICPVGIWTSGRRSHSFRPFTWQLTNSQVNPTDKDTVHQGPDPANDSLQRQTIDYSNWIPGRPRVGFGQRENCIFLDRTKDLKWNQRSCDDLLCVICQVDIQ